MSRLVVLVVVTLALAIAIPDSAQAATFHEVKKLLASDAQAGDSFGVSVAASGDTLVVGAVGADGAGDHAGAVYVFQRDQGGVGTWGEVTKLTASDAEAFDSFGISVAFSGDTAVVGASDEDAGGNEAGAAYVFERDEGGADNWGEIKKLTASDPQAGDRFGLSVAISGDTVVVGAAWEASTTGAAYVFRRDQGGAGNWGEVKKLTASDAQFVDFFGFPVAVNGDTAVVGASGEATGGSFAGAAYVFQRNEGGVSNWGEVKKLTASDAEASDLFGISVAISGDTALVGAQSEDAGGVGAGAAYVFQRNLGGAGNWGELKKLISSDAEAGDRFGNNVAVGGDRVLVGAVVEDAGGTDAGAAYVFGRDEGGPDNWGELKKLTASDAQADDNLGSRVAFNGDTAVVGASREDAGGNNAGAVYVFDLQGAKSTATNTPAETLTPTDTPTLTNTPTFTNTPTLTSTPTPAITPTPTPTLNPVGGIALDPDLRPLPLETDPDGSPWGVIVAALAAASLAAGGAVWYARRRLLR
ncbi:MAG: FG-GAP repeat protein [Chloroflexi bacterium]|nr:FG-GAP repeat protein [Chloroflexota bacterium]